MRRESGISARIQSIGAASIRVMAIAFAGLSLWTGTALAGYTFTGGGTSTGTATGDSATTALYLTTFSGLLYHSTDGVVFSPDWGGGLTISPAAPTVINVVGSTGDGSMLQLGHNALGSASTLLAAINVSFPANTTNTVVIQDSTNATAGVTYTVDTLPGHITAPGINYNEGSSHAIQGGVTLITGSGGNTINIASVCCGGANHEPFVLNNGTGPDKVNVRANNSQVTIVGQGLDTVVIGSNAPSTGGTLAGIVAQVGVTNPASLTTLTIDDSGNATGSAATVTGTQLTGLSSAPISYNETDMAAVTINGGSGGNTFTVNGTSAFYPITLNSGLGNDHVNVLQSGSNTLSIHGQAGQDAIVIGSLAPLTTGGNVAGIAGTVNVDNSLGFTDLTVDDSGDATGRTATVSSAHIEGLAAGVINYAGGTDLSSLTINGGSGSDSFTVTPWSQLFFTPFFVTLKGGNPIPPATPGDSLAIDLSGGATGTALSAVAIPGSGYSGSYSFTNRNAVVRFSEFETLAPNQTISFTSTAPAAAVFGGSTYTVAASATSGLTVAFTIDATATSVCSISGTTVSFTGVGTCVINANQAGNGTYQPAPQAQQSFTVGKGSQSITFTSTPPTAAAVGGATYTVAASATSGLTVAFTIDATATSVCSIAGTTVSFTGAGTCVIDANQAGNANYLAAPQVQQAFVVKIPQTITFTSTAPTSARLGGPTYTVAATATSGLTVAFTIDATATSVCSIAGTTVSFTGAGTCVIDANQAGSGTYLPAPQVAQRFDVANPSPAAIPTLNEWGMMVLSGLLGAFALVYLKRRSGELRRD